MKKILVLLYIAINIVNNNTFAQSNYNFKINGLQSTEVYLALFVGKNIRYKDTAKVVNGEFTFKKDKLPNGVYAVLLSTKPMKYVEFIINNETNTSIISTDSNYYVDAKVVKSKENKALYQYFSKIIGYNKDIKKLHDNGATKEEIEIKSNEINEKVKRYQSEFNKINKDLYASKYIQSTLQIEVPEAPEGETNQWRFEYYKTNFWNNFDLKDDRMSHSQIFGKQLDQYFLKVIPQIPDTIIKYIDNFLNNLNPGGENYEIALNQLIPMHYETHIMGMERIYVHMFDNYVIKDKAPWIDKNSDNFKKIKDRVDGMRYTLIGNQTTNLILPNANQEKWINLHDDVKNKYTMLVFWAEDCSHCIEDIPKLKKIYDSIKNTKLDFEIYSVGNNGQTKAWMDFVAKHKLNWINVARPLDLIDNYNKYLFHPESDGKGGQRIAGYTDTKTINYQLYYDVFQTPKIYLLDKDKKIIAKDIEGLENYFKYIDYLENKDKKQ